MNFASIRIVLTATSHPGNIGSSARALKTMGFSRLCLVTPKSFPDQKAYEMSAGAEDVLDQCQVYETLYDAVKDCSLVIATSARPRGMSLPGLLPRECAELVDSQPEGAETAIVFGREHAGLTNEELLHCQFHVNIPASPVYSSLNLAQAVQIIVYELRMKHLAGLPTALEPCREWATIEETEHCYRHLMDVLLAVHFLKPNNPGRVAERIRRLFNRIRLEKMEVGFLRGMLSHIQKFLE